MSFSREGNSALFPGLVSRRAQEKKNQGCKVLPFLWLCTHLSPTWLPIWQGQVHFLLFWQPLQLIIAFNQPSLQFHKENTTFIPRRASRKILRGGESPKVSTMSSERIISELSHPNLASVITDLAACYPFAVEIRLCPALSYFVWKCFSSLCLALGDFVNK